MTDATVSLVTIVGQVQADVAQLEGTVTNVATRLAVLEAIAITPGRLATILTVAAAVVGVVFGGITAAAVWLH